jgi:adenylate cyclase
MRGISRHLPRMLVTLVPLLLALAHVLGLVHLKVADRLEDLIYDTRLRLTSPKTLDERIVIVDVDEKSLLELGRWPWPRDRLAALTDELFERQKVAALGFDMVFAEPDTSSGQPQIRQLLAAEQHRSQPASAEVAHRLGELVQSLDHDQTFARALQGRPVVLGYYFTSDRNGYQQGQLPNPVWQADQTGTDASSALAQLSLWDGYGANLPELAQAALVAGYFNSIADEDGLLRSVPLLVQHGGAVYESLSLAVFRQFLGNGPMTLRTAHAELWGRSFQSLQGIEMKQGNAMFSIPLDRQGAALVPYRGKGGPTGGAFAYVSAADVLQHRLPAQKLKGKIILVGTTAPGLLDLRTTPLEAAYPGVEVHANLISGFLDGRLWSRPDYAMGYELVLLLLAGTLLALVLPVVKPAYAVLLSLGVLGTLAGLNTWLLTVHGLLLPLGTSVLMVLSAFALNMSYGYFVESRTKQGLALLFGTYVPPELVDEMVKDPGAYSMRAEARELTVLFCDIRGFTSIAETLPPEQLQTLLNQVFSRLTQVIRAHGGTIDKYMGDCVMAFWGAPVPDPDHAIKAVHAALAMVEAVAQLNAELASQGMPVLRVGIGINTGTMRVGDMGSDIRRSYTVIGDAVNLAARLEALTRTFDVDIVAGDTTRRLSPAFSWLELERVQVKGKEKAVTVHTLFVSSPDSDATALQDELLIWGRFMKAYQANQWDSCELELMNLSRLCPARALYAVFAQRVAERQSGLQAHSV